MASTLWKIAAGVCLAGSASLLLPRPASGADAASRTLVPLSALVPAGDPLGAQDVRFDARFAALALESLRTGARPALDELADLPATVHLLNHARNFDYDVPKDSPRSLAASLLAPAPDRPQRIVTCGKSLEFFTGPLLDDPHWLNEVLKYLPPGFRFHGTLFLTFGYDIGVAYPPNASLNGAARHFDGHPRELLYYAIHELHHAGFMALHPPPRFSEFKTCRDLVRAAEYLTLLEGMAVLAVWERRRADGALGDDADYVALQDEARMQRDEALYLKEYEYLKKREGQPADPEARAVLGRLSGGERLWYRVGARIAGQIEKDLGRPALVSLVQEGPGRFFETFITLLKARRHAAF